MQITLSTIANTVQTKWAGLTDFLDTVAIQTLDANSHHAHFPKVVAQTTEGKVMDGPRGLQLITQLGPTPVDQTPDGFLVYRPVPHFLQTIRG